jgi:hypothetical protein
MLPDPALPDRTKVHDDPATSTFAAYCAGLVCLFAGDLHQASAHFEDGLARPAAGARGHQRSLLLLSLAVAAGLTGDEERVARSLTS